MAQYASLIAPYAPKLHGESGGYWIARSSRAMTDHGGRYLKISSVSGLRRKLLQELNRIGQLEMATIWGISAVSVM
jgi:hypothetical protein